MPTCGRSIKRSRTWAGDRAGRIGVVVHRYLALGTPQGTGVGAINQIHMDRPAIEQKVQTQVTRWQELVASAVVSDGRQLLNEVLEGPLKFTPLPNQGKVYHFTGLLVTGKVIAGIIGYPLEGTSPTGHPDLCSALDVWFARTA